MKKALIVSTVSRQFTLFERENINILIEMGYEVHCAANYNDANDDLKELDIKKHHIDIQRSPFSFKQIKAFFQLKKLMNEQRFNLIHCHAPMGGVLGRVCAKVTNTNKVIYTAHGFHFYKGAPIVNNIIYKNIEKLMARYTDILITMNNEDYEIAKKFKLKPNGRVVKIPGVGVDTEGIKSIIVDKEKIRKEIEIPKEAFLMLSVGELIPRKNHIQVIKALSKLVNEKNRKDIYYVICGRGILLNKLKEKCIELNVEKNVKFLGYRKDVYKIMKSSDIFIFPSLQEGLPKSVMEAMSAGMPIIASEIRGNIDLIENNKNGFLVDEKNSESFFEKINQLYVDRKKCIEFGNRNLNIIKNYDINEVNKIMKKVYGDIGRSK